MYIFASEACLDWGGQAGYEDIRWHVRGLRKQLISATGSQQDTVTHCILCGAWIGPATVAGGTVSWHTAVLSLLHVTRVLASHDDSLSNVTD